MTVTGTVILEGATSNDGTTLRFQSIYDRDAPANSPANATDATGMFTLDLNSGPYVVEIQPNGSAPVWLGQDPEGNITVETNPEKAFDFFIEDQFNQTFNVTIPAGDIVALITVSGAITVANVETQEGVAVRFWPASGKDSDPIEGTTDSLGAFSAQLPPDAYRVEVQVPQKVPFWVAGNDEGTWILKADENETFPTFFDVSVSDLNVTVESLVDLVTFSGTITSDDGVTGVANANVMVWPEGEEDPEPIHTTTNDQGVYSLSVMPGLYRVEVQPDGESSVYVGLDQSSTEPITVAESNPDNSHSFYVGMADGEWQGVNFSIPEGATFALETVTGTIKGINETQNEAPIRGAEVRFWFQGGSDVEPEVTFTSDEGAYTINVAPGSYKVEVQPPGKSPVFVGVDEVGETFVEPMGESAFPFFVDQDSAWHTINLTLDNNDIQDLVTVTGEVREGDELIQGAEVSFYRSDMEHPDPFKAITSASGLYDINVPPGPYEIVVEFPGKAALFLGVEHGEVERVVPENSPEKLFSFFIDQQSKWKTINVVLEGGQSVDLAELSGVVTLDGEPQSGVEVAIFSENIENAEPITDITDAVGLYTFHVAPGPYTVAVGVAGKASVFMGLVPDTTGATLGTPVVEHSPEDASDFFVGSTQWQILNVDLIESELMSLATLTGIVKEGDTLLSGAEVRLLPVGIEGAKPFKSMTNKEGVYDLDIPPGQYTMGVKLPGKASVFVGLTPNDTKTPAGDPVVVLNPEKAFEFFVDPSAWTSIDVTLIQGQAISLAPLSGFITVSDLPLAGIDVRLWSAGEENPDPIEVSTNADGFYELKVSPALYRIEVQLPGKGPVFVGLNSDTQLPVVKLTHEKAFPFFVGKEPGVSKIDLNIMQSDLQDLASLTGVIRQDGVGVPGADVRLWPAGVENSEPLETNTDGLGNYDFDMMPGLYRIEVALPGKAPVFLGLDENDLIYVESTYEGATKFILDGVIRPTLDLDLLASDMFSLVPVGGTISENGILIAGAEVRLWPDGEEDAKPITTRTNTQGVYDVGVPPGLYRVEVKLPGKQPVFVGVDDSTPDAPINIAVIKPENAVAFEMEDGVEINTVDLSIGAGVVQSLAVATGLIEVIEGGDPEAVPQPMSGVDVLFIQAGIEGFKPIRTVTDGSGHYDVDVPPGLYEVTVEAHGSSPIFVGHEKGAEAQEAFNFAAHDPKDAHAFDIRSGATPTVINLTLDKSDVISLVLINGRFNVVDFDAANALAEQVATDAGGSVGDGDVGDAALDINPEVAAAWYGQSLVGADVRLWPLGFEVEEPFVAVTNGKGEFELDIPPGLFKIEVQPEGSASVVVAQEGVTETSDGYLFFSYDEEDAFIFDFKPNSENNEGIHVSFGVGELVPLVTVGGSVDITDDQDTKPAAGAVVRYHHAGSQGDNFIKTRVDGDGFFELDIAPGSYVVEVQPQGTTSVFVALTEAGDIVAVVNPEDATVLDFRGDGSTDNSGHLIINRMDLKKLAVVTGSLFDDDDLPETPPMPIVGAEVMLWPVGIEDARSIKGRTDGEGNFEIGVPPGVYKVQMQPMGSAPVFVGNGPANLTFPVNTREKGFAFDFVSDGTTNNVVNLTLLSTAIKSLVEVKGMLNTLGSNEGDVPQPMVGAKIRLRPFGLDNGLFFEGISKGDGSYSLDLPSGVYSMEVQPADSVPLLVGMNELGEAVVVDNPEDAHAFTLFMDDTNPDANVVNVTVGKQWLVKLVDVEGRVVLEGNSAEGNPAEMFAIGAKVSLISLQYEDAPVLIGMTDGSGNFSIPAPPGLYRVKVKAQGLVAVHVAKDIIGETFVTMDVEQAATFDIRAETTHDNWIFVYLSQSDQTAQGKVVGSIQRVDADTIMPVVGADVVLWEAGVENPEPIKKSTDGQGMFSIGSSPGMYKIEVSLPGSAPVFVGRDMEGHFFPAFDSKDAALFEVIAGVDTVVDIQMAGDQVRDLAQVFGTIQRIIPGTEATDTTPATEESLQGLPGADVLFWRQGEENPKPIVAVTDGEGNYDIGLSTGAYSVEVALPGQAPVYVGKSMASGDTFPVDSQEDAHRFFIQAKTPTGETVETEISLQLHANAFKALVELTGSVIQDTKPLQGAEVVIHPADHLPGEMGGHLHAQTDFDGNYTVRLAPGIYKVETMAPGFVGVFNGFTEDGTPTLTDIKDEAVIVEVEGEGIAHNFVLDSTVAARTVEIRGRISRSDGGTMGGVDIKIHPVDGISGNAIHTVTGPMGNYAMPVGPGLYRVEAIQPGFAGVFQSENDPSILTPDKSDAVIYDVQGSVVIVDMVLDTDNSQQLMTVSGTVLEGTNPVAGAEVKLFPKEDFKPKEATLTDENGFYELDVQPGRYKVRMTIPGFVGLFRASLEDQAVLTPSKSDAVRFEVMDSNVVVDITASESDRMALLEITGAITDGSGEPIQGADVVAHPFDVANGVFEESEGILDVTDQEGNYGVELAPGSYAIELKVPGFAGVTPSEVDESVLVSDPQQAKIYTLDATNSPLSVSMVFNKDTAVKTVEIFGQISKDDHPVMGAEVIARSTTGAMDEWRDISGPDGDYGIDVQPGSYTVEVMIPGFQRAFISNDPDMPLTGNDQQAQIFEVVGDTEVSVQMGGGFAGNMDREKITVSGKIVDTAGNPVGGVHVMLQPEFDPNSNSNGSWEEVSANSDGTFEIMANPGLYRIEFQTKYWDWETDSEVVVNDSNGVPLDLIPGFANKQGNLNPDWDAAHKFGIFKEETVNVTMKSGLSLSGNVRTIVDGETVGVVGAEISVHTLNFRSSFWTRTETDGAFSVKVEPGQKYVVEVWPQWCDDLGPADEFESCKANRADFMGGNLVVDANDPNIVRNSRNEPVITASVVNAAGSTVSGTVLAIWEPEMVTQFVVDESLTLGLMIDKGTELKGQLLDGSGVGIPHAWVDSGFGGTQTKADGTFNLVLPTASSDSETFQVAIWPQWCDPHDPEEKRLTCEQNRVEFVGGVVVGETSFKLSADWDNAKQFKMDGSDWPTETGLMVGTSSGITITGQINGVDADKITNVWVNAWSHTAFTGGGTHPEADGTFSIRVEEPSEGATVFYEVGIWDPNFISPEPVLVRVESTGVTGVFEIDHDVFEGDDDTFVDTFRVPQPKMISDPPTTVTFSLSGGNTISGRVVDSSGQGIAWQWVDIHNRNFTKFAGAGTDENGFYSAKVEPGKYIAVVWGNGDNLRTTWYNQATDEKDATLVDVTSGDQKDINFRMTSGASVSGTLTGATSGKLFINLWSDSTRSWGGKEITLESDGPTSFTISGLREANDYRLDWQSDDLMSGFYGGTLKGDATGAVGWERATLINTKNGNVEGVNISLGSGTDLSIIITGMVEGDKVDAGLWSDTLQKGGWEESKANVDGIASFVIKGLDSTGKDYRLFVNSSSGKYKAGNFKGTVVATADGTEATAGSLVGWDHATLIDMSVNQSLKVTMGTGATISGSVTGLDASQEIWIDAFSQSTYAWGGTDARADATGTATFTIKGLKKAKDFRVSINGEGVQGGFYGGSAATSLVRWDNAALVDVRTENATGIDMSVSKGVSISGTIGGTEAGSGLKTGEWAWVDAWSDSTFSWSGSPVEADSETSGASVTFKLAGLASASDYEVHLDAQGYVQQRKEGVDATADVTGVSFILSTGGKISGSISGLTALEGVWLDAWSPSANSWGGVAVTADSTGAATFTIDGLTAASDYVVALWAEDKGLFYKTDGVTPIWSQHSPVTVGSTTTENINFKLEDATFKLYKLQGTVTLTPDNEDQVVEIGVWGDNGGDWTSRIGSGSFTLQGLPSGSYTVEVFSEGYIPRRTKSVTVDASGVVDSESLTWTSGWQDTGMVTLAADTTGLNVGLSTGFTLSGTVTDSTSTAVSGAWVNAWDNTNFIGGGALTNSSGQYSIDGLPEATYTVDVKTSSGDVSQTVTLSETTTVNLTVVKELGAISGAVTTSSSVAKAGATVVVFNASGEQVTFTVTDASGTYKADGLSNGDYTLKIYGDENGSVEKSFATTTTAITVAGSEITGQNFTLSAP